MGAFIEFDKVTKQYGTADRVFYALKDASFTIEQGEMVVILGPSGAGKSTLLNLLGGMDVASSGSIISCGEDISQYNDNQLTGYRARNVAVVFQFYNLIPTLTAYENVALMRDIVTDTMDPKEALESVGLGDHMHQFPAQMSGGQKQRVAAARSLISDPDIILADEPTGALDTKAARLLMEKLYEINHGRGRTILMVTHDPNAASFCSRILFIQDGVIFHELRRKIPTETREEFYARILQVMAQMGGGSANVL